MRTIRLAHGWTAKRTAEAFGCHPSHITRVEVHGTTPSRELVNFYEHTFEADGLLLSLFEVVIHSAEQNRRRSGARRAQEVRSVAGDATAFVEDTIPHGTLMRPGQVFTKTWTIRNAGTVTWEGRRLERQGPLAGPGLITSSRHAPVPVTLPGETALLTVELRAPTYDASSIAYFKMVHQDGHLCFPDVHQLGLDVLVLVRRNLVGKQ